MHGFDIIPTPNLKIDLLAEIRRSPRIISKVNATLKLKQMKTDVDEYLKTRQRGSSVLTELKQKLLLPSNDVVLVSLYRSGHEVYNNQSY
ncbi:hypothetical protein L3X38_018710 [Prunus dulcis]|uniref:CCR4-Not complex component Not1 C-terminal domain-containing protein n=1 Tax=Prunus dulcis TaxID=3755 RepID=A0AAD4W9Q5_PRUDU|nr:hypothetical protein L3X38_018710 [Prunus dulcis]